MKETLFDQAGNLYQLEKRIHGKTIPAKIVISRNGLFYLYKASHYTAAISLKNEYDKMQLFCDNNVPTNNPIEFFKSAEQNKAYWIAEWKNGRDLYSVLLFKKEKEQQNFGNKVGNLLKCIHNIDANCGIVSTEMLINDCLALINVNQDIFDMFPTTKPFVEHLKHARLNRNTQKTIIHGDFHTKNLIYNKKNNELSVIDSLSKLHADPYEDFVRVLLDGNRFPKYVSNIIDSYFCGNIPADFWEALKIYVSIHQVQLAVWCIKDNAFSKRFVVSQNKYYLKIYNRLQDDVPTFYRGN